jgi:hypothetical protein
MNRHAYDREFPAYLVTEGDRLLDDHGSEYGVVVAKEWSGVRIVITYCTLGERALEHTLELPAKALVRVAVL